jgi:polysaccharide export outer membrane protein
MKNYLLALLIIGFTGCTSKEDYLLFNQTKIHKSSGQQNDAQAQQETITQLENIQFEYKIQPHDRVSLVVYKHADLSTSTINSQQQERGLLVNSKGNIRIPLIKSIHVAGLTQTEAEDAIENALQVYIKQPDVQVEVLNKRAYIIGEVKNPGEIELVNERLTLLQIIAKAGDLTDEANRKSILILRGGERSQVKTEVVNLTDINSLKMANLMIKPNDIVYVTPNSMKAFNTGVKEIDPIFNLIGHVLTPFVSIKFLSN